LFKGPTGSDAAQLDCENRTSEIQVWFEKQLEKRHAGTGLSRLPKTESRLVMMNA